MTVKNKLQKRAKDIQFNEELHRYNLQNDVLISVTTLIKKYTPEFDEDGSITARYAEKNNMTVEQVRELWDAKGKESADNGTKVHKMAEIIVPNFKDYGNIIKLDSTKEEERIIPILLEIGKQFEGCELIPELVIYNKEFGLAGTIDLLSHKDNAIDIWDYKTNSKPITEHNTFNKFMLEPISHIPAIDFYKYALQLSFYKYMLEQDGYTVNALTLIHLKPNNPKTISLPYLKDEVKLILEDYNAKKRVEQTKV